MRFLGVLGLLLVPINNDRKNIFSSKFIEGKFETKLQDRIFDSQVLQYF